MTNNLPVITATSELNAALILESGAFFLGKGIGKIGEVEGEICFNTSITGYQEILTDPSYTGQIVTFSLPHVGNVGANRYDCESQEHGACGLVIRDEPSKASSFRSEIDFNEWLISKNITGISGIDTREITIKIRENGACNAIIVFTEEGQTIDLQKYLTKVRNSESLAGQDLASKVSCKESYAWQRYTEQFGKNIVLKESGIYKVVVLDFGVKENILNCLLREDLQLEIVPANTSFADIKAKNPDGVFLSNGPGDPAATGEVVIPVIKEILAAKIPVFGICLGHQLLALASGLKTTKMHQGHRGANHPVLFVQNKTVEITSQNHGFVVPMEGLSENIEVTHISLFDQTIEGLRLKDAPAFSVQYHPESSPGPHDSKYLFKEFVRLIAESRNQNAKEN